MSINIPALFFLLALAVLAQPAEAGFISFETSTVINVLENRAQAVVTVTNKGDEAAHNVKVTMEIDESSFPGSLKNLLQPKEQYRAEFETALKYKKPGRYPVIVSVEYTDANLYPFTAPSVAYLNYGDSSNARATGTIANATVTKTGSIRLTINNLDTVEREFNFRMVAPKELLISGPKGGRMIAPGESKTVSFEVRNISALPGSNYPVFAVLGYEDDKYYYSTVATGSVTVARGSALLTTYKWPLAALLVILVLIVAAYNLKTFRKRGPKT
ncbi:MAG TPA: hypothetical protein VN328_08055 [Thermodesulfovibrionales bacterium]|nr:hypothetical protein [Thermodesulfovibrionales bacterium]